MATNVVGYEVPMSRTAWGAIFAGTFVYLAIMSTFGILGAMIFGNAGASNGFRVWMTILGIVALFFAGRAASHLCDTVDRNTGMYQGLITFGMSVFATILVLEIALSSMVNATVLPDRVVSRWDVGSIVATGGWALFVSLFLGMIAAAAGGWQAAKPRRIPSPAESERTGIRSVA